MDSSLSVEATNRIRVGLGLKPIPVREEKSEGLHLPLEHEINRRRQDVHSKLSDAADRAAVRNLLSEGEKQNTTESTADWVSRLKEPHKNPSLPGDTSELKVSKEGDMQSGEDFADNDEARNKSRSEKATTSHNSKKTVPVPILEGDLDPLSFGTFHVNHASRTKSQDFVTKETKFKSRKSHKSKRRMLQPEAIPTAPRISSEVLSTVLAAEEGEDLFVRPSKKAVTSSSPGDVRTDTSQSTVNGDTASFLAAFKTRNITRQHEHEENEQDALRDDTELNFGQNKQYVDTSQEWRREAEEQDDALNDNNDNNEAVGKGVSDTLRLLTSSGVIFHDSGEDNDLQKKDAFKELSHAFHGTSEGKKRRQRRERRYKDGHEKLRRPLFPD